MRLLPNIDLIWTKYNSEEITINNKIHLFSVQVDTTFNRIATSLLISDQEKRIAERYKNIKDQQRYKVSKHCLRVLLSQVLGIPPLDITYNITNKGKPTLPEICFNISHSNNYVLIAISNNSVGIDVEYIDSTFDHTELLSPCFSSDEVNFINKTPGCSAESFYTLWTRKEALLKATGEGLVDDLSSIFVLSNNVSRGQGSYLITSGLIHSDYLFSLAVCNGHLKWISRWIYDI